MRLLNPTTSFSYWRSIPWLRSSRTPRPSSSLSTDTMPPSPLVMFLVGYRLNMPKVPKVPTGRPSSAAPWA